MDNRYCTKCNKPVQRKFPFCGNCGAELSLQTFKNDKPLISTPEGNYSSSFKEKPAYNENNKYSDDSSVTLPKIKSLRFLPHILLFLVFVTTYQVIYGYFSFPSHPDLPIQMIVLSFFTALIAAFSQHKFPSRFIYLSLVVVIFVCLRSIYIHENYREWLQFQSYAYQHGSGFDLAILKAFILVCIFYVTAAIYTFNKRSRVIQNYSDEPEEAR